MVRLPILRSRPVGPTSVQLTHDPIPPVLQLWEMLQAREQQARDASATRSRLGRHG